MPHAVPSDLVRRLAARDRALEDLGLELVAAGPGTATLRLTVAERHLNFNGTCHGGVLFALADAAFGLASNSHGVVAAGIDAHMSYSAPARPGDVLTATATELTRSRRLGTYRAEVVRADGKLVAAFTGTVFITEERHTPD